MTPTIFFSVGEPSGDLHGANLIKSMRRKAPDIRCIGYGGPKMAAAGCEIQFDLTQLAVMWVFHVITNFHKFLWLLFAADRCFRQQRPAAVILIDYPGFNWWIARRAKARGIPVFYYGTPQLWAWAPWRVAKLQRLTDHVLCKLPFEQPWFAARGCNAHFVGHPYFDELAERELDQPFVTSQTNAQGHLVTILPGSRDQEVDTHLGPLLRAASLIQSQVPQTRFAIASFKASQARTARQRVRECGLNADVYVHATAELIEAADVCLACSGSVSLELLFHATPSIIYYQVNRWAFWLQDKLRISKYITLTNLLDAEHIERVHNQKDSAENPESSSVPMPEYLVCDDRSASLAEQAVQWLTDEASLQAKIDQLVELRTRHAKPGASERAAEYIIQELKFCESLPTHRLAS